ncbi:MAG: RNA polymerase sigma factor [Marmoricola sp.]
MRIGDDERLEELVVQARGGDPAALEELLTRIRPMVVGRCRKFLPFNDDADEAAQDALLAIATKLDQFSGRGSFRGWAVAVASNSARDTYRSLTRRAAARATAVLPERPDARTTSVIAGVRLDVLEALDELERRSPKLVEPFMLRDLGGLPYDQIAALTQMPVGTVKARIHQARTFMRSALVEHGPV